MESVRRTTNSESRRRNGERRRAKEERRTGVVAAESINRYRLIALKGGGASTREWGGNGWTKSKHGQPESGPAAAALSAHFATADTEFEIGAGRGAGASFAPSGRLARGLIFASVTEHGVCLPHVADVGCTSKVKSEHETNNVQFVGASFRDARVQTSQAGVRVEFSHKRLRF